MQTGVWIEHDGGEMPVPAGTMVLRRYVNETREEAASWDYGDAEHAIWDGVEDFALVEFFIMPDELEAK